MAQIDEIAPDVFRLSVFYPQVGMSFNHFLVRDDEPLLMHAGLRLMFPQLQEAVKSLIDPAKLRWVTGSHFESDEWGALNQWLAGSPYAQPLCGFLGAVVNLSDFADKPVQILNEGETLETGSKRFRVIPTAHVPHGWDSAVLFEETEKTLFSSDLLHQGGETPALTEDDVLDACRRTLVQFQQGPFANYVPYRAETGVVLERLAALEPTTLAAMHGASYRGDGAQALRGLAGVMREVLSE